MKVRITFGQDIVTEYELPEELGHLVADCWNAGHDGVAVDPVIALEGNADANGT